MEIALVVAIAAALILGILSFTLYKRLRQVQQSTSNQNESVTLVSHNFLTPLGRIRYAAESLRGELNAVPPERQIFVEELLQRILSDTRGLIHGTVLLLENSDLVRKEETDTKVRMTETAKLIQTALNDFRPLFREKNITFEVEIAPGELPRVSMNELYFETILEVLLDNALKYTPMGGRVTFSAKHDEHQFVISVEDTGVGMSGEELASLFSSKKDTKNAPIKDSGMGLGLIVSKHIIERHGGNMKVDSQGKGRGSTYTLTLPLRY